MFDLKRFRKEKKVNQTQLAELIGVSQSAISQAEKGEMIIPDLWIDIISRYYEIEGYNMLLRYFRRAA